MEPLDENELNRLLRTWQAPDAPSHLKERLRPALRRPWWQWLWNGNVRVPVPVALAMAVLLALWIFHTRPDHPPRAVQPSSVSLAGFKPVRQLEPVVVVGAQK